MPLARTRHLALAIATLATFATLACSGDSTGPGRAEVAGSYRATTLAATQGGMTEDALAAGATLTIELRADGTTTGDFFLPAALNEGTDEHVSMAGSWTLDGSTVRFQQSGDSFVPDIPFTYRDGTLRADQTISGARIVAVLTRQS